MRAYAVAYGSATPDAGTLTPAGYVTQKRGDADDATLSVDGTVSFDSELWDAIFAQMRWAGARLMFEGVEGGLQEILLERHGQVQVARAMIPGDQASLNFETIGSLWAFPSITPSRDDYGGQGQPPTTGFQFSPRLWGNKVVEFYQSFGKSPSLMKERKLYRGLTFEKRNRGNTQVTATIGCVDDSIRYSDVPICYELAPQSGKLRGDIVRDVAVLAGVPKDKIFCPAGSPVNKPILLTNASLIPFVTDLGTPENWFCYFDENGNFVVEEIELKLKEDAEWVFDAKLGDFYLDTFEETLPSRPPQKYYATGTGPGGDDDSEVTTESISEQEALYARLCTADVGVLGPDGQYRLQNVPQLFVVQRTTTRITTKGGIEIRRLVVTESFYNPMAYDPNFNTVPPGTDYSLAYGDKSFHRDKFESLMETSRVATENEVDQYGTLLGQVVTTQGWFAPKSALIFSNKARTGVKNYPGNYIFPAWSSSNPSYSARQIPIETYQTTQRVERTFTYDADGNIGESTETLYNWNAPQSRSDFPPPPDVIGTQPGGGGPPPASTSLVIVGPISHSPGGQQQKFSLGIALSVKDKYGFAPGVANLSVKPALNGVTGASAGYVSYGLPSLDPSASVWTTEVIAVISTIQGATGWALQISLDLIDPTTLAVLETPTAIFLFTPSFS